MVTYVITPTDTIQGVQSFLGNEFSQAANIKSKTTMNSVQSAITSTKEKLKHYKTVPKNGLIIFCGQILMDDNKTEKKITLDIEPFRPVQSKMYKCENKFHAECLNYLLEDDEKFGFVIVDGNGALFATLQGNVRNILHKLSVELPKKHGRGGQSANRFARLREEKRHAYVRKIAELTV
jgi:peptide chain release factor subunit 1